AAAAGLAHVECVVEPSCHTEAPPSGPALVPKCWLLALPRKDCLARMTRQAVSTPGSNAPPARPDAYPPAGAAPGPAHAEGTAKPARSQATGIRSQPGRKSR